MKISGGIFQAELNQFIELQYFPECLQKIHLSKEPVREGEMTLTFSFLDLPRATFERNDACQRAARASGSPARNCGDLPEIDIAELDARIERRFRFLRLQLK